MEDAARVSQKPATAARMYDYYLGGIHNFPADQEAARQVIERFPFVPLAARANRAFLGRAVQEMSRNGIRQFLDIGSGIPTVGNVHEIAQSLAPESRVVYVDIDPVAVAEGLDILHDNPHATAIHGDLGRPREVLDHPTVRRLLDFDQPVGLLLAAVLHFIPEDAQAYGIVTELLDALAPGSYLLVSHTAAESFIPATAQSSGEDIYQRRTATPGTIRTRTEVERFFTGLELLEPGVVWAYDWRPDPAEPAVSADTPFGGGIWAGVGRKP